ncbi:uncharacterized protein JCM15063_006348 [Sporobolomyces koalae]|uniref:uncharacterized protein n=1 Tax=Sporobolomyces koalae TaxID=500713 RepID=UPI00316D3C70
MSKPRPKLTTLPPAVLDRIVDIALSCGTASPLALISHLGRTIHHATWRVLAANVILADDDAILVRLERTLESDPVRGTNLLTAIVRDHSHIVRHLVVTTASPSRDLLARRRSSGSSGEDEHLVAPLDDHALYAFLERFPHLSSFTWTASRLPPEDLCIHLATSARNLLGFTFHLAPSSTVTCVGDERDGDTSTTPTSPSSSFLASSCSPLLSPSSSLLALHGGPPLSRWDGPHLSHLADTLTSLALSSLSHTGAQRLTNTLSSFLALEHLDLSKTVFVDDSLLGAVAHALAKTLKRLAVRDMTGTKLSDAGIKAVFEECVELESFEFECVEGRLSRGCWNKIDVFPPRLHTLKFCYSESGPHKSWVLDHLQSISSLLSLETLDSLTLSRKIDPRCQIPGSHHPSQYPLDPTMIPRKITGKELGAIVGSDSAKGTRWKSLNLDLLLVDAEDLKSLLEKCTEVKALRVCFDDHFKHLLPLSSSFAACLGLQHFLVSIPLAHSPGLQTLTPSSYMVNSSALLPPVSPLSSPSKSLVELPSSQNATDLDSLPDSIQSLLPSTRDWRRFLKKSHDLHTIEWTGRGGIGKFKFGRVEGKGLIQIVFQPTPARDGTEDGQDSSILLSSRSGTWRERQASWNSSSDSSSFLSSSEGLSRFSSRSSSFSFESTRTAGTTESISKSSPVLGLSDLTFGSIAAELSNGHARRKSSMSHSTEFSATPLETSTSPIRGKSFANVLPIGTGWNGFSPPVGSTPILERSDTPRPFTPLGDSCEDPVSPTSQPRSLGILESTSRSSCATPTPRTISSSTPEETLRREGGGNGTKLMNAWNGTTLPASVTSSTRHGWASSLPCSSSSSSAFTENPSVRKGEFKTNETRKSKLSTKNLMANEQSQRQEGSTTRAGGGSDRRLGNQKKSSSLSPSTAPLKQTTGTNEKVSGNGRDKSGKK